MNSIGAGSLSGIPDGRIIDFDAAELRRLPFQDSLYLWVKGSIPGTGLDVRLSPRIYRQLPDYWAIEVAAVPAPANDVSDVAQGNHFERSVPLTGTIGSRGIAVIGASRIEHFEVSDKS